MATVTKQVVYVAKYKGMKDEVYYTRRFVVKALIQVGKRKWLKALDYGKLSSGVPMAECWRKFNLERFENEEGAKRVWDHLVAGGMDIQFGVQEELF
jgi:hypothetical protein